MLNIYMIPSDKIGEAKKVLENPDVVLNKWSRNGYLLRDARTLGFEKQCSYLYVNGPEEFFTENEKQITEIEGIEKTEGDEFEKVKQKIDAEEDGALSGVGAIFG